MSRITPVILGIAVTVAASGCAFRSPKIGELQYNPGRYQDRTVSVTGVVTNSWGGAFVPVTIYQIDDGTGQVTVVSAQERQTPARGARVRVRGKVNNIGVFGGRSVGLHIREDDLDFLRD
jgi:hypothetical protein